ncbi:MULTISPECIES: LysR family transcriptional regulator [Lactiplantibacillus]|uniref:LysR family transcriptional regulator n=1 Tax=Lactiplantibacillus pentosus TaxID=1589 RepID=A0ABD7ILX7_LACPE|nr:MULTISPECIES: LysR family transcriptional regulator [Lactiplantibacillus]MCC3162858.1 LysR family transcriptional regulator [Lactiplantibacillus pentosus]MCJ8188032.1 LysR family transcriptional regulator [Lactiplantibacillus pentosus]MCM8609257.1 LysR family transcriptional regulator [Lactiplantibacillus sp. B652]PRO84433.1 LysR family transcriptional regulator [Lactiplantibacillus pentosus]PRO96165.1 LysR family transcriptional regulator [Lactiplantibacillus pentosus]
MNLRHLIFFKELARTQHMAKAAENLGISQPSLSYAIKKLEHELGVPLFEADGRNIKLTSIGGVYLKYVTATLNDLSQGNELVKQLMDPDTGHVKLGFTYTLGQQLVPELMSNFKSQPRNQAITFELGQGNSQRLLQGLADEQYDIVLASNVRKLGDQFTAHLFDFIPLVQQEIVAVMPNDHPLAKSDSLHVADLAAYPMIQFSKNSGLRPLIDQILAAAHVQPKVAYEVEEDHTMAGFVRYKLGVALMPYLPLLNPSQVCIKHLVDQPLNHQIYLIVRRSGFVTPAVHRFQEFARSYCWQHYTDEDRLI